MKIPTLILERRQVINLLKDMSAQLEKEAEEDKEVFEKVCGQTEVRHHNTSSLNLHIQ